MCCRSVSVWVIQPSSGVLTVKTKRRHDHRNDAEKRVLGQNEIDLRDVGHRRIAQRDLDQVHRHREVLTGDGQRRLARLAGRLHLLAGDEAVHEHIRDAVERDDDDDARDDRIEVARRQQRQLQQRRLADGERQLKAACDRRTC